MRGLEAAEQAFRDGEKQTMIWREEVEVCAEQQSSPSCRHDDIIYVHKADRDSVKSGRTRGSV